MGERKHLSRLRRLWRKASDEGAEAVITSFPPHLRYLLGFSGSTGWLVVCEGEAALFVDGRYTSQAKREVPEEVEVVEVKRFYEEVKGWLKERGVSAVGVFPQRFTVDGYERLKRGLGRVRLVKLPAIIEEMRAVKEDCEVEAIKEACRLAQRAFERALGLVREGVEEQELQAEIVYFLLKSGSEGLPFDPIVASGENSALPHAKPSGRRLKKGDLVIFDLGARVRGYCSDITRTVSVGRASSEARRMYRAVWEAQRRAAERARPGMSEEGLYRVAERALKRWGMSEYFKHGLGHGLGLEIHESPSLAKGRKGRLKRGMVITIEPGVYIEGVGGVRIEDDFLLTAKGAERLTEEPAPPRILEV
ncbi:MAG TPA: aminopeptidase P family protein [Armatimonadetes bacterium]|nr:aminopeptidase P family protein [Armatimonadota bacterium]